MIGSGAALGFTAEQTGQMTLWEFASCLAGYARANTSEEAVEPPTGDQLDAAILDFYRHEPKEWTH